MHSAFANNHYAGHAPDTCPKCNQQFRLLWPFWVSQIPPHRVIDLRCPFCRYAFSMVAGTLTAIHSTTIDRHDFMILEALPASGRGGGTSATVHWYNCPIVRAGPPSYARRGGVNMNGWKTTRLTNSDLIIKIALLVLGFAAVTAILIYNSYLSSPHVSYR